MKNIILATTALVATAGVAAAEVSISGYARFGATYSDNANDWGTASRLRLQFDASTETDGGITFGVRKRFQTEENLDTDGAGSAAGNGARFYATAGGFTFAMGNILGVIEAAPNLYLSTKSGGVGLEGNGFYSLAANTSSNGRWGWTAYSSGGAGATDGVEILYSMGGLGLHLHSTDDGVDASYGIGANYTFSDYTVAVAYEEFDSNDSILFASVGGNIGAANVALSYAETEYTGVSASKWSLQAGYDVSTALNVYGFVSSEDNNANEAYGLGASYDLGGGVSIEGGVTQTDDVLDDTLVSLGAFFSF